MNLHNEHRSMVKNLFKDPRRIMDQMTNEKLALIHAIMGISGESGELLDALKKAVMYNKPLDTANVVEKLGDLEFCLEALRQTLGIDRKDTLAHNIEKLTGANGRYREGRYSDEAAQSRRDKTGE